MKFVQRSPIFCQLDESSRNRVALNFPVCCSTVCQSVSTHGSNVSLGISPRFTTNPSVLNLSVRAAMNDRRESADAPVVRRGPARFGCHSPTSSGVNCGLQQAHGADQRRIAVSGKMLTNTDKRTKWPTSGPSLESEGSAGEHICSAGQLPWENFQHQVHVERPCGGRVTRSRLE